MSSVRRTEGIPLAAWIMPTALLAAIMLPRGAGAGQVQPRMRLEPALVDPLRRLFPGADAEFDKGDDFRGARGVVDLDHVDILRPDAGLLENHGCIEKYGVDTGDLLEDGHRDSNQQDKPRHVHDQTEQPAPFLKVP